MEKKFKIVVKTLAGLEPVLATEIRALGAGSVSEERRAVSFLGDKSMLYKANFLLRTALRVLRPVCSFRIVRNDDLYARARRVDWSVWMNPGMTFAVDSNVHSDLFTNSMFVSLRVKDAIADYFRETSGKRPSVSLEEPDIRVHVHLMGDFCEISLDSSGESLHKRGYRVAQSEAPLNEVLAAGMILLSGWNGQSDFMDPMCGSGTLLIEAAMVAANIPPGIYRKSFGFEKWPDFDQELFSEIYEADYERESTCKILGSDISAQSCAIAAKNIASAGLTRKIVVNKADFLEMDPPCLNGLLMTNPPYGERLRVGSVGELYKSVGDTLKLKYSGFTAWVISGSMEGLKSVGLKPARKIELFNGSIPCSFRCYELFSGSYKQEVILKKTGQKGEAGNQPDQQ